VSDAEGTVEQPTPSPARYKDFGSFKLLEQAYSLDRANPLEGRTGIVNTTPLSVSYLQKRLRWPNIVLRQYEESLPHGVSRYSVLRVLPSAPEWSAIDFVLDEELLYIHSVNFSEAHWHYERWTDERRNFVAAARDVAKLVHGQLCLVEELDGENQYCAGHTLAPDGIPEVLQKRTRRLRRTFFDRQPYLEEVDHSRYLEEEYLFIRKDFREELNAIARSLQEPPVG
jgi:hypothetical protein